MNPIGSIFTLRVKLILILLWTPRVHSLVHLKLKWLRITARAVQIFFYGGPWKIFSNGDPQANNVYIWGSLTRKGLRNTALLAYVSGIQLDKTVGHNCKMTYI